MNNLNFLCRTVREYYLAKIPDDLDYEIRSIVDNEEPVVQTLLARENGGWYLHAFAARMASMCVLCKDIKLCESGLRALIFEAGKLDIRDTFMGMSLLFRASEIIGYDGRKVFVDLASVLKEVPFAEELKKFANRSKGDRTIASMGYKEGVQHGQFRFIMISGDV